MNEFNIEDSERIDNLLETLVTLDVLDWLTCAFKKLTHSSFQKRYYPQKNTIFMSPEIYQELLITSKK